MSIDAVTLELVKNAVESVVDEMALTIMRTAYSMNLKSSNDLSSAYCSLDGELLAQGFTLPMQLGSIPDAMAAVLAKFGNGFEPGDCVILNDPYEGGTHLPDIFLIKPLFLDGQHVAYCATIAHHTDIGGRVAGGNASDSTEIYQEGLRLPPLKLFERGRPNQAVFDIISRNVRVPDNLLGDLRAQLAAIHIGERGLAELAERWGGTELFASLHELMAYTERLARAEIARWPDGTYAFTDYIDDDGLDPDPIPIHVAITVRGDELEVDFEGTAPQVRGALNATGSFARSAVYACVRGLMDSGMPNNGGYFRPIHVRVPEGSVINPHPPAAVAARGLTGFRIANALFGALAQIAPDRVPACESGGDTGITIGGYDDQRRAFVFLEFLHGSWGGRPDRDGIDACSSIVANFSNNPIEQLEAEYPLRIEQYGFVPDSGGAGKFRGGLALIRDYRFLEREGELQLRTDRHRFRPWGLAGGKPGTRSMNVLISGAQTRSLASKEHLLLHQGDVLRHTLAGAGGYGDPLERDPSRVAADVGDAKVSIEHARQEYGVVLDRSSGQPDLPETAALRTRLARGGPFDVGGQHAAAHEDAFARCDRFLFGHGRHRPSAVLADLAQEARPDEEPDRYGEGSLIEGFERDVAAMLGKEAAVFLPSGTMAQQIALRVWADRKRTPTVAFHPTCHLEIHEQRGLELLHGLHGRLVGERSRLLSLDDLRATSGPLAALLLELPQREIGGQLPSWPDLEAQVAWARDQGVAVHMDGARLWECGPFYERSYAEIAGLFDSVYVSFYKGIGAIAGAALAGPSAFIAEARPWQRRHGGNLVQLYPFVLSARANLRQRMEKFAGYFQRAQAVARVLSAVPGIVVKPDPPQTNMLHVYLQATPAALLEASAGIARTERVQLFRRLLPTGVPGVAAFELAIGDAAEALTDQEIGAYFERIMATAGSAGALPPVA